MAEQVATSRGAFHIEQSGPSTGRSLVFVAGLGDDHASWADPIAHLSTDYHCVTFDNRGIGRSPITDGPYRTGQMAQDVQAIVEALGVHDVVALGSSMGGAICQEWALAHPETIDRLVLSNTWGQRDAWFSTLIEHWIQLAGKGAGADVLYQLALFCFSPGYLAGHPDTVPEFLAAELPDLTGFAAAGRACQDHDALDRLRGVDIPTLVIGGTYDILTRPDLSRALAAAMPGARLAWLAAGHMTFWEQPKEWATLVREFLAST